MSSDVLQRMHPNSANKYLFPHKPHCTTFGIAALSVYLTKQYSHSHVRIVHLPETRNFQVEVRPLSDLIRVRNPTADVVPAWVCPELDMHMSNHWPPLIETWLIIFNILFQFWNIRSSFYLCLGAVSQCSDQIGSGPERETSIPFSHGSTLSLHLRRTDHVLLTISP